jgi:hypothetical protein
MFSQVNASASSGVVNSVTYFLNQPSVKTPSTFASSLPIWRLVGGCAFYGFKAMSFAMPQFLNSRMIGNHIAGSTCHLRASCEDDQHAGGIA